MLKQLSATIVVASLAYGASSVQGDTINNAYTLCQVFDDTGLLSDECSVSGWNQAVEVSIDTSSSEARKICQGVVSQLADQGVHFDPGWTVRIYSPFSNGNTIATCALPN
jgi:hypothetical protein